MEPSESSEPSQPVASTPAEPVATPPETAAPAEPVAAPAETAGAAVAAYEFSGEQNQTMGALGNNMGWVGIFTIIAGVVVTVLGVRQLMTGRADWPVLLVQGVLNLVVGIWTRNAAEQFNQVATTSGADIQHLMGALGELRRIYHLQKILILVAIVLMVVAVIFVALAAGLSLGSR
jgi:hypothetical protein